MLAATAAVLYALAARIWPASIGENEISNRIGQPFQYWNAVGSTAALAIPGLLWLGTRRGAAVAGRVLAYPALGAAILALLLTQSRGALAAAILGTLLWLAIVPLRLRALPLIALSAAAAAPVARLGACQGRLLDPRRAARRQGERGRGVRAAGAADARRPGGRGRARERRADARRAAARTSRRRIGIVALAIACAAPLAAFTSVAFSNGGIGGAIGDRVDQLTSESQTSPTDQGAGRLTQASSTRGKYWREAGRVFEDRPAIGLGAGNFQTARLRHRTDTSVTRHAHGFVPQTLADLGIVGVALTTALLLAWLFAAARVTGLHPRRSDGARRDWDPDRLALVAATLMAVVFGLQSAIDWTWFVPGPTAMALVAAGFVAGRAPLGQTAVALASTRPLAAAAAGRRGRARRGDRDGLGGLAARGVRPRDRRRAAPVRRRPARRGDREDQRRRRLQPAQLRPAAHPRGDRDPGRPGGRRRELARGGGAQVPGRAADLVPPRRLPAGHARPAAEGRRHGAGRDLPRPEVGRRTRRCSCRRGRAPAS